jgi:Rad52/22 family double-strand break repair protein
MQRHADIFKALAAPFEPHEIKARTQQGRKLSYITGRTAMNRLDTVVGPADWWDDYVPFGNGVKCLLTLRLPDGSTVTKTGVGGITEMHDASDTDKTGESDALKRAGVKFGIARYLYRDGSAVYEDDQVAAPPATRNGTNGTNGTNGHHPATNGTNGHKPAEAMPSAPARSATASPPRTGRALFAWTKDQEQRHEVSLLKYLNGWAKLQEFPSRMVEFNSEQVARTVAEAMHKLASFQGRDVDNDPDEDFDDDRRFDDRREY